MFVAIPTRLNIRSPCFVCMYIYLLDSSAPYTTLTHRALCALHGKAYSTNTIFNPINYLVGPCNIEVNLSNPNPKAKNTFIRNLNVLGRNFFRQLKKVEIIENI